MDCRIVFDSFIYFCIPLIPIFTLKSYKHTRQTNIKCENDANCEILS